jgi:hypothetical protein
MIREFEKKGKADRKQRQTDRQTEGKSLAGEFRYSDRQYRCIDYLQHFESLDIRNRNTVTGNVQTLALQPQCCCRHIFRYPEDGSRNLVRNMKKISTI